MSKNDSMRPIPDELKVQNLEQWPERSMEKAASQIALAIGVSATSGFILGILVTLATLWLVHP